MCSWPPLLRSWPAQGGGEQGQPLQELPHVHSHHFRQLRAPSVTFLELSGDAQEDGRMRKLLHGDANQTHPLGFGSFP